MELLNKIKMILKAPMSLIYSCVNKAPEILNKEETIEALKNKSIARYGDGELYIMLGLGIKFQEYDKKLSERLKEVAVSNNDNCLIAIPRVFTAETRSELTDITNNWWKKNLLTTRGYWYKFFGNKVCGDSFISRFYLESKDKSKEIIEKYISTMKKVWDGKDIVFVEGNRTRMGMGNDLFSNAKSIKRILGPGANAFSKYDQIYEAVINNTTKDELIICALGPTATILAYDLAKTGRHVLDLGHIDIEYEWFLKSAQKEENIKGKDTSESGEAFIEDASLIPDNVICEVK